MRFIVGQSINCCDSNAQDETRKDAGNESMTFVYAGCVAFVMDIHSRCLAEDRRTESIVTTHDRIIAPFLEDQVKCTCLGR